MAGSTMFPMFIKDEYQSGTGFAEFQAAADRAFAGVDARRRQFEAGFEATQRVISQALSTPRNQAGALDLNVGEMRAAADAAEARAIAAREVAAATRLAAQAEGDYSEQARLAIASTQALAKEAEQQAAAARSQAVAAQQVQAQLDRQASATQAVVGQTRAGTTAMQAMTNSASAQRFAYVQLGQQLQDVAIQAQLGVNPLVILTQQGSQAAFALSGMGGVIGRVATFLSGPWGAAVLGAVTVVGLLTAGFFKNEEAAKAAEEATKKLADRQLDIANFFDVATGAVKENNRALIENAILKAELAAQDKETARRERQARAREIVGDSVSIRSVGKSGASGTGRGVAFQVGDFQRGNNDLVNALNLPGEQRDAALRAIALSRSSNAGRAQELSDLLAQAELDRRQTQRLTDIVSSLKSGTLAPSLLEPKKGKKERDTSGAEAKRLAEFGETAAERIQRINEAFNEQPRLIDRASQATRALDDITRDLMERKPKGWAQLVAQAEQARMIVEKGLVRPYADLVESQEQSLAIGDLMAAGRNDEADAMQQILRIEEQMGPLSEARRAVILANTIALREQSEAIERQRRAQDNLLGLVRETRENVRGTVYELLRGGGVGAFGNFFSRLFDSYLAALSEEITATLTDGFFQKQTDKIKGETSLSDAGDRMAGRIDEVNKALATLGRAAEQAAGRLGDAGETVQSAATDDIVVTGQRQKTVGGTLKTALKDIGNKIFGKEQAAQFGKVASVAMQGAAIGTATSGILNSIGIKQSKLGAQIGGAIGNAILPGIGGVLGSVFGGTVGQLLVKPKFGSALINGGANGQLAFSTTGNNAAAIKASSQGAEATIGGIEQLAAQLGGYVDPSRGLVSIGQYKGKYRVNTNGLTGRMDFKGASANGLFDFGDDAAAAVQFATMDLIKDGVIQGIRQSTRNLLTNASDLQAAAQKALTFEQAFRDLKRYTDPVGAALDDVNMKFRSLINIARQAGASAEEMAQLEQLYQRQRADATKQAIEQTTGALKQLLSDITVGDSGYSLRTRLSNAQAAFDPLAARVRSGDSTAYDEFTRAAQTLLELQRAAFGSQSDYFALLQQVEQITRGALGAEQAKADAASASSSIFDPAPLISATETQTRALVGALQPALNSIAQSNAALVTLYRESNLSTRSAKLGDAALAGF